MMTVTDMKLSINQNELIKSDTNMYNPEEVLLLL